MSRNEFINSRGEEFINYLFLTGHCLYPHTAPLLPSSIHIRQGNRNNQAVIDWNAQSSSDGFIVTYEPNDGIPASPIQLDTTATSVIIDGLNTKTSYSFVLRSFAGTDTLLRTESDSSPVLGMYIKKPTKR